MVAYDDGGIRIVEVFLALDTEADAEERRRQEVEGPRDDIVDVLALSDQCKDD